MDRTTNIMELKGVGEKTATAFGRMGIRTVDDLISTYPRYYLTYDDPKAISEIEVGQRVSVAIRISTEISVRYAKRMKIVTCNGQDGTGNLSFTWFNMPYLKKQLHRGGDYVFTGTPIYKNGRMTMEHPEIFLPEDYQKQQQTFQPVYPLTAGLKNKTVSKTVYQTKDVIMNLKEYLPEEVVKDHDLMPYATALWNVHFPQSKELLIQAKRRLIFDEFFVFVAAMSVLKGQGEEVESHHVFHPCKEVDKLLEDLPYELTGAQMRAFHEMQEDVMSGKVMNRLVQGDVGSGKTILAQLLLLQCVKSGYQGVMMAPTEVLSTQHYESFQELLGPYDVRMALLTGSTKAKDKREIYEGLKNHDIDLVIGTHALIQEPVEYDNLALVITDEQHRFGVRQREALAQKGEHPHVMVMSATPIPRTLGIILYGDLDVSIIDELPANRQPIKNCVVNTSYRPTAYRFMEQQVSQGRQVYVICPMVEESEAMEGENVVQYAKMLQGNFSPSIHVECLHGKMKAQKKQEIMDRFAKGEIHILVSTTVVEVGVNVPNATVMMVENAERFGLAQLHQLRGRVGRGKYQSYCIFMTGSKDKDTMTRLEVLNHSNDGFHIANEDLRLRGPGNFFGVQQSGQMDFSLGDIYNHADILKQASDAVSSLVKKGFDCSTLDNPRLKQQVSLADKI